MITSVGDVCWCVGGMGFVLGNVWRAVGSKSDIEDQADILDVGSSQVLENGY